MSAAPHRKRDPRWAFGFFASYFLLLGAGLVALVRAALSALQP